MIYIPYKEKQYRVLQLTPTAVDPVRVRQCARRRRRTHNVMDDVREGPGHGGGEERDAEEYEM